MVNLVTRAGRPDEIPQVGRLSVCDYCGSTEHQAVYSHEGRWGQGPIYAVVCTEDQEWRTAYYTLEVVVIPA